MKQLQFTFKKESELEAEIRKIRQWYKSNFCSTLLIQVFTEILDRETIQRTCALLQTQMPEAVIAGCSSNGNILNGDFSGSSFAVVCTMFEYPSTKVEVLQYPLTAESQTLVTENLCEEVKRRPWVKGVEMLVTIRGMSVTALCEGLSNLPEGVQVFGGGAFNIFLLRQFFITIPEELDDAARIDGCSYLGIYARIIIPMSRPVLAAVAIFAFQNHWNEFLLPLIYIHSRSRYTLALGLRLFQEQYWVDWSGLMAASTVIMLPVLLVFYFAQRYFIQGIVFTGVKG